MIRQSTDKIHISLKVIKLLFAHGGSVGEGQLLHYAVWRKQPDRESFMQREPFGIGKLLLDWGADIRAKDTRGQRPYERARAEGHTTAASRLLPSSPQMDNPL
ncbi:hypothetical protein BST61_g4297 [Cercospora zeina]